MAKKIQIKELLIILLSLLLYGCSSMKYYVFGVEINKKDLNPYTLAGIATGLGTHILGHYIFADIYGVEIHQEGIREVIDYYERNSDLRAEARGGFVLQGSINLLLTMFEKTRNTSFTKGYTMATIIEIQTYSLIHNNLEGGDFYLIDSLNGNGEAEHEIYSIISFYNILRISDDL